MADAIGPGSFVTCVDASNLGRSWAAPMRVGSVWCVAHVVSPPADRVCAHCGKTPGYALLFANDPSRGHAKGGGWCPDRFRPFNGPEQAKRKSSEPTTTTRGTEVVG